MEPVEPVDEEETVLLTLPFSGITDWEIVAGGATSWPLGRSGISKETASEKRLELY